MNGTIKLDRVHNVLNEIQNKEKCCYGRYFGAFLNSMVVLSRGAALSEGKGAIEVLNTVREPV